MDSTNLLEDAVAQLIEACASIGETAAADRILLLVNLGHHSGKSLTPSALRVTVAGAVRSECAPNSSPRLVRPPLYGPREVNSPPPDRFRRWSAAVREVVQSDADIRTSAMWAQLLRVSPHTLRGWCRVADTPVKSSLDLGRILRAARLSEREGCSIETFLDVAHPATMARLLRVAGLEAGNDGTSLEHAITHQRFVCNRHALTSLIDHLNSLTTYSARGVAHG